AAVVVAIVELGDGTLADRLTEGLEAARTLRNGYRQQGLALLADLGALGHMTQAIEVDIGTRIDGHQHLAGTALALDILLDPGHTQATGGLADRTGAIVDVLDGRAHLVGGDSNHLIDVFLADIEGVLADLGHRHAVGELADLAQGHPPALLQGSLQAVGVARLDADHLDLGTQVLHIGGDPGDQPATAHRHEDGVQLALVLTQYLHGHGT